MELLAPVGSKESFITAIRAGADAVYIGVPDFNARISASNITFYDLQVMIDHAHQKKVKVFLALNTLIKYEEIHAVVKNITYIEELEPDAVIVQDLGVAGIMRKYFPDIPLHASTQMAVHNRMGVDFLAEQGFKRAILARELSFAELNIIAKNSPLPLEVFCHGALCFSLSGMCLFSSFIGGLSGNRGRCTQPCRRRWQNGKNLGYLFSPRDLELAGQIGKLKKIGIASLKIEGRMRSSEYVYRAVKAYRMLIDASEKDFENVLKDAQDILKSDTAREKTAGLFSGRDKDIFQPQKAQCLGNYIGTIDAVTPAGITVKLAAPGDEILVGDRLRVSNPAKDTTIAFKIKELTKEGSTYIIPFGKSEEFSIGNPVFKTVDKAFDQKNIEQDIDAMYDKYAKNDRRKKQEVSVSQSYTALISNVWKDFKKRSAAEEVRDTLWVKFDNAEWLGILPKPSNGTRYIFSLKKDNLRSSDTIADKSDPSALAIELPPFIGQRDTNLFKEYIDSMVSKGVKKWVLNNVSQFGFFKGLDCELTSGHFLYVWNAYAAAFLSELGVKYFTTSWEDDFLNIRNMCGPGLGKFLVVYLYGFAPLVRSRLITKEMLSGELISDGSPSVEKREHLTNVSFLPIFESDLALLIPEKPVNIFTARRKFKECGIETFGIDLSFIKPDKKQWLSILDGYTKQENILDSIKFNFKRGIK